MTEVTSTKNGPHILLLGATGRSGTLLAMEALERGYSVTALVRDRARAEQILPTNSSLRLVVGDPCSSQSISSALTQMSSTGSHEIIIISTLGQTRRSGNPWAAATSPPKFMSESAKAMISALSNPELRSSVAKIITMSTFGTDLSFSNLNFVMRLIMRYSNMAQTLEDHNLVFEAFQDAREHGNLEGVEVVQVRSTMLKEADAMPVKVFGDVGTGIGYWPSVTIKSVVDFMLDVAAAEKGLRDGRTPVITN